MKKKARFRQITALTGVILLAGMYLTALICAIIRNPAALTVLKIALCGTFFIPVLVYIILMFYKLTHRDDDEPHGQEQSERKDDSDNNG